MFEEFKKSKEKYTSKTALIFEDMSYSYEEIYNMVLELIPYFNDKNKSGVIFLEKNEFSVIFQLVLNKSNNNFTCLDIATPKERVLEIVNQLQSQWIISLHDFFSEGYILKSSSAKYKIWEKKSEKIYNNEVSHIYFSSGSTGKPKGILLPSKPLVKVIKEQARIINMNENKKFAWILSPSFDASLSDIYVTLFSGGQLHICNFPQSKIKTLIKYFNTHKITHSDISPSILPFIPLRNLSLETIIFGGEVANEEIIKNYATKINMYNAYGPTENTICSSLKKVDKDWTYNNIGSPMPDVIFDISETKELFISGSNICIEYMDSVLNDKKFFIKDNKRYYRSGDLVEYKNGEYFYLGRSDRQFKHNGVLISPEEIEQCAKSLGCIEAKCQKEGKYTLYYQGNMSKNHLRNLLEKKLNKNMIPSILIKVDSFKTNINGKKIV